MKICRKLIILLLIAIMLLSCGKSIELDKSAKRIEDIKNNTLLASAESFSSNNAIPNWKDVAKEYDLPFEMNSYELNNQGYSLYEDGLYDKAASLFQRAIEQDPLHPFASYNLACMLSLMMESGINIDTNRIKELLIFELSQDPSRFEKIKQDKDLTFYRNTDQYKKDYKEFIEGVLDGRWLEYVNSDYPTFIILNTDDYSIGGHGSSHYADEGGVYETSYYLEKADKNEWEITDDYKIVIQNEYDSFNGSKEASIKKVGYNYIDLNTYSEEVVRYYKSTTTLHESIKTNDLDRVKKLIDRKVNIDSIIFNFSIVNKLKDQNSLEPKDFKYSSFITPLFFALENKQIEIVEILLNNNATLNPQFNQNYLNTIYRFYKEDVLHPPFIAVIKNDDIEVAQILLEKYNLDLNYNIDKSSYLVSAVSNSSVKIIKFLIKNGMDVNKKYWDNDSILQFANSEEVIDILKKHGAKE